MKKSNAWSCVVILSILIFTSCRDRAQSLSYVSGSELPSEKANTKNVYMEELQAILDSNRVRGTILIYDDSQDTYYSNDFDWADRGVLPASTFKIVNSIIGLETGTVESDTSIFHWDGTDRWSDSWEQDLPLERAFHLSCVPCYQELARSIGVDSMRRWIDHIGYGNISFDASTIDNFWLRGDSRVSPMQQIDLLRRLHHSQLPISDRTETIMKKLMIRKKTDSYVFRGKTGLSNPQGMRNGWFVGYLTVGNNVYYIATNIEPIIGIEDVKFTSKRLAISKLALENICGMQFG